MQTDYFELNYLY